MIKGMKFEVIAPNLKVLSKSVAEQTIKETGEVKTYYNLTLKGPDGEIGKAGCELDVYNSVIEDKTYDFRFTLNTSYDKVFVRFHSFSEAKSK